eukprot:symbB.v1.2.011665.t1/scaffold785.1/size162803/2
MKERHVKLALFALLLVGLSVLAFGMRQSFSDKMASEAILVLSAVFFFLGLPGLVLEGTCFPPMAPRPRRSWRCKEVIGFTCALLLLRHHEAFVGLKVASSPSRVQQMALADGELPTGDELLEAAEQVREQEVISEVLPKLPDWADFLVGKFLLLMPVAKH